MSDPSQPAALSLSALIKSRWSCREYRPDPVPREAIEKMLDAARWAPSACNRQPWRFTVVTRKETRETIKSRGLLPGLSAHWVAEAPVLIVLGMCRAVVTHRMAPWLSGVDYAWIDLGIAGEHLVLRATELGLATCWIGWIRPGVIRKLVGWPISIRPAIVFTVGWPRSARGGPTASNATRRTDRLPISDLVQWME